MAFEFDFDFNTFHKRIDAYLDETSKRINKLLEEKKVEVGRKMFNTIDLNKLEEQKLAEEKALKEKKMKEEQITMDDLKEDKKTKLAPPWVGYANKFDQMFGKDPQIHIKFDDENCRLKVRVDSQKKYEALKELLPSKVSFGNINLYIDLIPSNAMVGKSDVASLFADAFEDNPVLEDIIEIPGVFNNKLTYIVFKKEVVQYWNDNLGDPHGLVSTLYQDIAKDIFVGLDGVNYCTNPEE